MKPNLFTERRTQSFMGKLTLAVIVILSAITQVSAQASGTPTTAIDIKEFSFTPSTIDVTNSSQAVTVTVRVTDTERDFLYMVVHFRSPQGDYAYHGFSIQERISGDGRDGVYRTAVVFPQYGKKGTWEVYDIVVLDGINSNYRSRYFYTSDLVARGFATELQVVNNNEEIPPEIRDFSITPSAVDVTNGSQTVTVTFRAIDATSGIRYIFLSFIRPEDVGCDNDYGDCSTFSFSITSANRISGNDKDGIYRVVFTVSRSILPGSFDAYVYASDTVNNYMSLDPTDLAARGYSSQFQILRRTLFDFDGDGLADLSVFRPSNGTWYFNNSRGGQPAVHFGLGTDKPAPADFDGDGTTDIAVFRDGTWYWLNSSDGSFNYLQFGQTGDVPVPADFSGDRRAEIAVWRPSNGYWYTFNLTNNQFNAFQFGQLDDKPVVGDYDGDGKSDYAVFRPSSGVWYYQRSTAGFGAIQFGEAQDKLVPADYDGDGRTDVAVFRPSSAVWFLQRSNEGFVSFVFGIPTDLPVPADFDGDGRADVAVFRDGIWYIGSPDNYIRFGLGSDVPTNQAR